MSVEIASAVRRELEGRGRVVALETTLISHGLPRGRNLAVARAVERAVREEGAVPATVGVIGGRIKLGLSDDEISRLALASGVMKASTRELALAAAQGANAGTTVAATIAVAARAGVRLMATGGIGGVHPGGQDSMDVSADLDALAKTPCCVVCAGPKAILDLARTMEALDTRGVLVAGYKTDRLPGFYVRRTGIPVPMLEGPKQAAALLRAQESLGWPAGVLLVNPPPADLAFEQHAFNRVLGQALAEAERQGVAGGALTPFLLTRIAEATGGRSVELNEALVLANARVAARIAVQASR